MCWTECCHLTICTTQTTKERHIIWTHSRFVCFTSTIFTVKLTPIHLRATIRPRHDVTECNTPWAEMLPTAVPVLPNWLSTFVPEDEDRSWPRNFERWATICFVMSVRPSVRVEQLSYHWTNCHEICYLNISRKFVEKIQVSLQSNQINLLAPELFF